MPGTGGASALGSRCSRGTANTLHKNGMRLTAATVGGIEGSNGYGINIINICFTAKKKRVAAVGYKCNSSRSLSLCFTSFGDIVCTSDTVEALLTRCRWDFQKALYEI
jgi:hypothetical protein